MSELTLIVGPMFSAKTTGLLMECEWEKDEGTGAIVFKPTIDKRYSVSDVVSHDGLTASSLGISVHLKSVDWTLTEEDISELTASGVGLVAVDEAQFFENIDIVVSELLRAGFNVVCAGLDMDSNGEPFGKMGELLAMADEVYKRKADCAVCGVECGKTFRKLSAPTYVKGKVLVGGEELYEPRCNKHWTEGMLEWKAWVENA